MEQEIENIKEALLIIAKVVGARTVEEVEKALDQEAKDRERWMNS